MAKHDLSKLIAQGQNYVNEFEKWEPPSGLNLKCIVKKANANETDEGLPRWGILLEVQDGEYTGKSFWVNARFSLKWEFQNKQCVDMFEALGIAGDTLNELAPELIATSIEAKRVIVNTNTNKKGYADHTLVPIKTTQSAPPPPPPPAEDDEDEDEDW